MKPILSLICLLTFATVLHAQKAGTLDKSFGDTGVSVETNFKGYSCSSLLMQADTKFVTTGNGGFNNISGFSAYRSLNDASADLSFGDSGRVATENSSKGSVGSFGALQADGKIVETGYTINSGNRAVLTVLRYKTNGNIDSTFGTNGIVLNDLGTYSQIPTAILVQPDEKIVVTGLMSDNTNNGPADTIFIVRFNSSGSIDASFGTNGIYKESLDDPFETAGAAIQTDGKILIGGDYKFTKSHAFFVKRYTSNGKVDSTFGFNGEADYKFSISINSEIHTIFVQSDGKILAGGDTYTVDLTTATLVRFKSNGSTDSSFGAQGMVITTAIAHHSNEINGIAVQSDNKIVTAGSVYDDLGDTSQYTVTRYLSNGSLDSTFGTNGTTITFVGKYATASSIVIETDGKIVLGGRVQDAPNFYISLVRYNSNGTKKQEIISKIKHYIQNHNNLESNSTADAKTATINITIAPNPVNSMLTINGLSVSTKYTVKITNENGNTVVNKQVSNVSSYQINVQGLSAGVYYVNIISNNNQSSTLKFIKQ